MTEFYRITFNKNRAILIFVTSKVSSYLINYTGNMLLLGIGNIFEMVL